MSYNHLKQKFQNHLIEVFPQAEEHCQQILQSESVFFQFTRDMRSKQMVLKTSFQTIHSSLLLQKEKLSAKCLSLHFAFLKKRDEQGIYDESLITERHLCEEEYLETIVKINQVEKILVDIQRIIEEIQYLETISVFY
jgi:hypothetical protein